MLDPILSKTRQKKLLKTLAEQKLDALLISQPQHVYYLSAHYPAWRHLPALVLFADERSTLYSANSPARNTAADEVIPYLANPNATMRQDQAAAVAALVKDKLANSKRIGFDSSETASQYISQNLDKQFVCIDDALWQQRRAKDSDELVLMKKAIDATRAMHDKAREMVQVGVSEIDVFNELHAAAVRATGEPMSHLLGNDFACGAGGGAPRNNRKTQPGELYILDLGPSYRGYFADNSRVYAVDKKLTDEQHNAWEHVVGVFPIVEKLAKPGAKCRDIYKAVEDYYTQFQGKGIGHHLGHGFGLQAHEYPHLNPHWDDVLIEGDTFTCEPGVYRQEQKIAIRIENQYLVTRTGVENLTPFPMTMI